MASFLCQVQTIQRAAGRSAVAAAAYRSGAALVDERLAMEFDFANKDGIEHAEIRTPEGTPAALRDREQLWNAAEAAELRKDGVPARELLLALPHELDFEQRRDLVRAFVDEHLVAKGMIADVAMHKPGKEGDQRNYHAHILVTTRRVGRDGLGLKDRSWRTPEQVRSWRAGWAKIQNEHLRRHLGPDAPQVSHLSLADRGIDRAPTVHLGPTATALERKNIASERGAQNRDVRAQNRKVREAHVDLEGTIDRLAAREPIVIVPVPKLVADAEKVRADLVTQRDQWTRERDALTAKRAPSERSIEQDLTAESATALKQARARLQAVQARVKRTKAKRLNLVQWVRNPARMIWAKHAELNALGRARAEVRRCEVALQVRRDWTRSEPGRAYVAARRAPDIAAAADVARQRRTLDRKIKRMDKRITAATRTFNDLRVAHELGEGSLKVPRTSPDATRFVRDVGAPARAAIQAYPVHARQLAVERLNRGQGRSLGRNLFPGR